MEIYIKQFDWGGGHGVTFSTHFKYVYLIVFDSFRISESKLLTINLKMFHCLIIWKSFDFEVLYEIKLERLCHGLEFFPS